MGKGKAMNLPLLKQAINGMKRALEAAITTATFNDRNYANGLQAKEALIRSQKLILPFHEVVKQSLAQELQARRRQFEIYPVIGTSSLELKFLALLRRRSKTLWFCLTEILRSASQFQMDRLPAKRMPSGGVRLSGQS